MYTQPPPPERRLDSLPHDEIHHRAPHPVVSLTIAAIPPATLVGISALLHHPRPVVAILVLLLVGAATAYRLRSI